MDPKFLFAVMLMLVPTVYGCINFQARFIPNSGGGAYPISAQLWDNLQQSDSPTCSKTDYADSDGLYHLNCFESDYTATFDGSQFDGIVAYNRPGGSFQFSVPPSKGGYSVCEYGCTQCFVPTF